MSLRTWALKRSELKPLSREGLLLLAARCALRVEPFCPPKAKKAWRDGIKRVVAAARGTPVPADLARQLARRLFDLGASACNALEATDETLGRCQNYAASALALALEAASIPERAKVVGLTIDAAKQAGSIAALQGHAGRVVAPRGVDPVDLACDTAWAEVRRDVAAIATDEARVLNARAPLKALRPLWEGPAPGWAVPDRRPR